MSQANNAQQKLGQQGEDLVRQYLRELSGSVVAGFFRTDNLMCAGRQVQLDFLVLIPRLGLLVLEVKTWKGTIRVSNQENWPRHINNYTNQFKNGSLQVLRASGLVLQMFEQERINRWPIRSLLVFTEASSDIVLATGDDMAQTDVIRLSGLKDWIVKNSHPDYVFPFTQSDFEAIKNLIHKYHTPYTEQPCMTQVGDVRL